MVDIIWSTDIIWAITANDGFRSRFETQIRGFHPLAHIMSTTGIAVMGVDEQTGRQETRQWWMISHIQMKLKTHRVTHRRTHRHTDTDADRHTDRQSDSQTYIHTHTLTHTYTNSNTPPHTPTCTIPTLTLLLHLTFTLTLTPFLPLPGDERAPCCWTKGLSTAINGQTDPTEVQ